MLAHHHSSGELTITCWAVVTPFLQMEYQVICQNPAQVSDKEFKPSTPCSCSAPEFYLVATDLTSKARGLW